MFQGFGREVCGILAPWPGIEPTPPALEGEVLTTGRPGKSQQSVLNENICLQDIFRHPCLPSNVLNIDLVL